MNSKFLRNFAFSLIIIGYLYYIYRYIIGTSFLIDGKTYYVLFDDAMISMRYARNLANGAGLVWNPGGERVQGFSNPAVTAAQRDLCSALLAAVGEVAWVEDEALLDPVTAVSGGGPAYVFLLIECLAQAGVDSGLPPELAMRLARVTVAGSG